MQEFISNLITNIRIKLASFAKVNRIPLPPNTLDEISMEEIVGRELVKMNADKIAGFVRGKVILVTGAGGSIGSELCRQIPGFYPQKLILLGHGENSIFNIEKELKINHPHTAIESVIADIQDKKRLEDVFAHFRPAIIFHAAAHKHVPLMELNPSEAIKNNVFGTRNVAECALDYKAERFVYISSDKAVNPSSIMGGTKRLAELMLQSMEGTSKDTILLTVRFGNVLGSRGSVLPLFTQQIEAGGPVTVTHPDMIRYFMTIPEAVHLIFQSCVMAKGGEIFILDMGRPVKILDMAYRVIRMSGLTPDEDIKVVYTGIRPGEKLVEELFTAEEKLKAVKHDSIYVCESLAFSEEHLHETLKKLEEMVAHDPTFDLSNEIRSVINRVIPGFSKGEIH
ncbi:UDP-N-acetylglucosamine 4,6-dehydratase family protein [Paenibacillus eucommiae]|uniref:FlaA1/EpsC-like NDP-sugar epimerase n=1 Tax=Paenibacillus eucommiae TaxID=1355755 RepID=A0ABS4J6V7_9BACL|nr:nucleoside-diphosphate sugar epimerase/dehydratase [Paenibacillus eucommiae]MBP1995570.1 FlaA1/EpsC-like NDP-sugar epimerase [Paenibacillus eucommiae]